METSEDTDIFDDAIQAAINEYDHAMGAADRLELPAKATIIEAENDRNIAQKNFIEAIRIAWNIYTD